MNRVIISVVTAGVLSGGLTRAQRPNNPEKLAPNSLERVVNTFRQADKNQDGRLTINEAEGFSIPRGDFAAFDDDGDLGLSRDEFVLYYRQLLVNAGKGIDPGLENEAARIQALRRAQKQRSDQAEKAVQPEVRPATRQPKPSEEKPPVVRASAARRQLAEAEAQPQPTGVAARLIGALETLEKRTLDGTVTPEQFRALRDDFIKSARAAVKADGSGEITSEVAEKLKAALAQVERKFTAGQVVGEGEFKRMRELLIQRARASQKPKAAEEAAAPPQTPAAKGIATRLLAAIEVLENRAVQGGASDADYRQLREQFISAARRASRTSDEGVSTELARKLQRALDGLQARAANGRLNRSDFADMKAMLTGRARQAAKEPKAPGADSPAPQQRQAPPKRADQPKRAAPPKRADQPKRADPPKDGGQARPAKQDAKKGDGGGRGGG